MTFCEHAAADRSVSQQSGIVKTMLLAERARSRSSTRCGAIALAPGPRRYPKTGYCWRSRMRNRPKPVRRREKKRARIEAARRRRRNRGALPTHLPRIETNVDIEYKTCPCCKGLLHQIGEDVSEPLDIVPAQFRALVTRRPKHACRACEGEVVQAPVPAQLIESGPPTEATVAHVLVSKYADHLPLYRQAQIYGRQGTNLDRSTLAD